MADIGSTDLNYQKEAFGVNNASEQQPEKTLDSRVDEQSSNRVGSSGFSNMRFPQNTEGHPAWVDIDIVERKTNGFSDALAGNTPIGNKLGNIKLYMPQAISFSDGLTYDNTELTGITSALAASANEAINGGGMAAGAAVLGQAATAVAGDIAARNSAAGAAAAIAAGVAINPRAAMLFKAPTFRQLALNFKMIPSNSSEARVIEDIIHTIRLHSYPELIAGGASYQYPNLFKIGFVSINGPNPWIMPFAHAYCTAVTVNYNPTSPALMSDGSPNEIDLTLSFQETKALDRNAIRTLGKRTTLVNPSPGPVSAGGLVT